MRKYALLLVWSYFLGPWQVGPFTTWAGCEEARQYQIKNGAANIMLITDCKLVKERYELTPPTYGAPLTPEEHGKRHQ